MKVLIVEDDQKLAQTLRGALAAEGFEVSVANSGEEGFVQLNSETFDVVMLDWMLPGRSGIEILKLVRSKGVKTPVLVVTARDALEDRVEGLDAGADDYLVKPFALPELLARIRALVRRGSQSAVLQYTVSDLTLDVVTRKVTRAGLPLELTLREFELLEYLLKHKGEIVSREMMANDVWKETSRATPLDNVIDVHIARLRKKIDQDYPEKILHTIRGVGFKIDEKS